MRWSSSARTRPPFIRSIAARPNRQEESKVQTIQDLNGGKVLQRTLGRGLQRCGALRTDAPYPFRDVAHLTAQAVCAPFSAEHETVIRTAGQRTQESSFLASD